MPGKQTNKKQQKQKNLKCSAEKKVKSSYTKQAFLRIISLAFLALGWVRGSYQSDARRSGGRMPGRLLASVFWVVDVR